ncbi:MAG: CsgG/HfaB family protein [Candidatus Electryonea clarkiae]|nr:CsgG/HfaB family protein [Candidatus Electryonea clarkiae]MDP8286575.1 CsgG/HfaB family protein [Candidatus Electryonea clarkiae]
MYRVYRSFSFQTALYAVFITICLASYLAAQPNDKTKIAVMDLTISGGIPENYQTILSDRLRLELNETGLFDVFERNSMQEILEEQGLQLSSCTSDECAIQMGKLLGVERMIAGSVGRLGKTHTIIIRMIDVETGLIVATKNVDCRCDIDDVLTKKIREVSQKLSRASSGDARTAWKRQEKLSPLPRSVLCPGLGQIHTGRTTPGIIYLAGEIGALGFLTYSILDYNSKVDDFDDARATYDAGNYGSANASQAQADYDAFVSAHDDAESAKNIVFLAGGITGGIYIVNIIDALITSGGDNYSQLNRAQNTTLSMATLQDSRSKSIPGVSIGIFFNLNGRIGQ